MAALRPNSNHLEIIIGRITKTKTQLEEFSIKHNPILEKSRSPITLPNYMSSTCTPLTFRTQNMDCSTPNTDWMKTDIRYRSVNERNTRDSNSAVKLSQLNINDKNSSFNANGSVLSFTSPENKSVTGMRKFSVQYDHPVVPRRQSTIIPNNAVVEE